MTIILDRPLFYLNHGRSRPLLFIPPFKGIIMVVTVVVDFFARYMRAVVKPGLKPFNLKRVAKRVKKRKRNVACDLLHKKEAVRDDKPA